MDRLDDQDAFCAELDEAIFKARLGRFTGRVDETQLLSLANDAADTARALGESSVALGDASDALAAVGREPPTLGALELRQGLARRLKAGSATSDEGPRCCATSPVGSSITSRHAVSSASGTKGRRDGRDERGPAAALARGERADTGGAVSRDV